MEELIKQAFIHVDVIGPHVQAGHYDLIGPNGEIILPQVWEKVIEPDWAVTMHMWPMDQRPGPPGGAVRPQGIPGAGQMPGRFPHQPRGIPIVGGRPSGGPPPPPAGHTPGMGMGIGMGGGMPRPGMVPPQGQQLPPGVQVVGVHKHPTGAKKGKPKSSGVLGWIGGGAGKSSKTKRSVTSLLLHFI